MMRPGIHYNIPFDEYLKIDALNKSSFMWLDKNPAHFKKQKAEPPEQKAYFDLGDAVHAALLQGDKYWDMIVEQPEKNPENDKKFVRNGAVWEAFKDEAGDKTIITQKQARQVKNVVREVSTNPRWKTFRQLIFYPERKTEVTIVFNHPEYGFPCKCRPDVMLESLLCCPDLKTTEDIFRFQRTAANVWYDAQAYWYLLGLKEITGEDWTWVWAVVDCENLQRRTIRAQEYQIENGRRKVEPLCRLYADCLEKDQWPGYPDEIEDMEWFKWDLRGE